ncbi:hypothetical protein CY35_15G075800 [Sphagnum magellanicum]|nr:hypothetical protein CY35_15G075800 [Sphagnum magellanicum]
MELSPFVHHHHHHGKKGRGGGGGGGGGGVADLWDVIDPLEIALTVLEEDAPRRARARDRRAIANTNVDWVETPEAHIFKVDLPGVGSSEIEVTVEDRTLKISGNRVKDVVNEGDTWHLAERPRGHFVRRFKLPKNADVDRIAAVVTDGVLTVIVPKIEPRRRQERRHIEVREHGD